MPFHFAETPDGLLVLTNGLNYALRWDGLTSLLETAGIAAPADRPALAGVGAGSLSGTYTCYVRFLDRFGNVSNLSPVSASATLSGVASIAYSNVAVPTDPKVVRRQILRNTDGEASVYYVDVDTNDVTASSFSSTRTDSDLQAQTQVPILDTDQSIFANAHDPPPAHKAVAQHHLGRMFYAVDVTYDEGCASVTFGSATVTGVGTEWTAAMAGRKFYVTGATQSYDISSVDEVNQTLTLAANYQDDTDPFAVYTIQPQPAERRLIYFSEAGQPESVPPVNAISLQEDGDTITGLMAKSSFLYILERGQIYRYTFQQDPARDGYNFLAASRGCVNQRCWVQVEDVAYMLDEQGVHAFNGGQECEPVSVQIQELFERGNGTWRVNWAASRYFHAAFAPGSSVIRWFVALSGQYLPRHALSYDIRLKRWWIEEYPFPVGASAAGRVNGRPVLFLSGPAKAVYVLGGNVLDGPDPSQGTVRGTATGATLLTLSDAAASFASGLANYPVAIVSGRGAGQVRRVASVTATTLTVTHPWAVLPDTTSVYQVGGIRWLYRTGDFRFFDDESSNPRRVELVFEPCAYPATGVLRLFLDSPFGPLTWQMDRDSRGNGGVALTKGSDKALLDLTKGSGFFQQRIDGAKELYADGPRYVSVEASGFSGRDPVLLYQVIVDGVYNG